MQLQQSISRYDDLQVLKLMVRRRPGLAPIPFAIGHRCLWPTRANRIQTLAVTGGKVCATYQIEEPPYPARSRDDATAENTNNTTAARQFGTNVNNMTRLVTTK